MHNAEIYYYSGTGNSLHVARELHKCLPETQLIPMVRLLNKKTIETKSETVGLVFPINLSSVPVVVRKFLRKLDLKSAGYIFAVATRCGYPGPCPVYLSIDRILKQQGKRLNSFFMLTLADNSPTGLKPSYIPSNKDWIKQISGEKIAGLEAEVQNRLCVIQKAIINREEYHEKDPSGTSNPCFANLVSRLIDYATEHSSTEINYYADEQCSGCGICEQVCLSGKIKMIDSKPVWQKKVICYHCYACFNYCPEQSVLISNFRNSYTAKTGRYFHPDVTAGDIAAQKQ